MDGDRPAELLRDLTRRSGPSPVEPLPDLIDEAEYWLRHDDELVQRPGNVQSLADELDTAVDALGPRLTALIGQDAARLSAALRDVAGLKRSDRHRPIASAREAVAPLSVSIASSAARIDALHDLADSIGTEEYTQLAGLGQILEGLTSRRSPTWGLRFHAPYDPDRPQASMGVVARSLHEVVLDAEKDLREPAPTGNRVVYMTITDADANPIVQEVGPITFFDGRWLRAVLNNPDCDAYRQLPQELTTTKPFDGVRLHMLPEDPPRGLVVARVELRPGRVEDAPSEAQRLLLAVLATASLRTRPGAWKLGDQYEYRHGFGGWDRHVTGPSTHVARYVAEELGEMATSGRLAAVVSDCSVDGPIGRSAIRLSALYDTPDLELKLVESVRVIETLLRDFDGPWVETVRRLIAGTHGARAVSNYVCDVAIGAASQIAGRTPFDKRSDEVQGLLGEGPFERRAVLSSIAALRQDDHLLRASVRLQLEECARWCTDAAAFLGAVEAETRAYMTRVRRVARLRNALTHIGSPPDRVVAATSDTAMGVAASVCLMAVEAQARGILLATAFERDRRKGDEFHRLLERGDIVGAVVRV